MTAPDVHKYTTEYGQKLLAIRRCDSHVRRLLTAATMIAAAATMTATAAASSLSCAM